MVMVIATFQYAYCMKGTDLELWLILDQIYLRDAPI